MSTTPSGSASRRGAAARRRAAPRQRGAAAAEDETEQVRALRAKYPTQLAMLSELFPAWSDEDLLFVLQESQGEVEVAVGRISEGHAEQFSSVKSKKTQKKEAAAAHAATVPTTTSSTATPPVTVVPAPAPTVASAESASSRRARTHERGSRGRGASTPAARGGRGGFRGVARGGSNAGVTSTMGAGVPNDTTGAMPVITTAAAFGLKTPQPTSTTSTPAPHATNSTATSTKTPASKPKAAMSWAQIARPVEPKPAPAETAPTAAAATAPSAAAPTSATDSATPATETTSSEKTLSADAPAKAVSVPPPGEQATSLSEAKAAAVSAAASSGSAPIAAAAASAGSRPSRSQRPPQDAAVVMPGNASSLDRLGMQFGSLNFGAPSAPTKDTPATESATVAPTETPSSAPTGAAASTHSAMPATQPAPQPVRDYDAFKGSAFAGTGTGTGTGTYGLSHAAPTQDDASLYHQVGTPTGMPASSAPGYSSMYAFDSHQRISQQQPYGHSGSGVGTALRSDDRMPTSSQPATPGAPPVPDAAAGMQQQPFPNVMPYYYPYYMPNQFQHFSPAAGFGQYPLYGGQPAAAQQQPQQQQHHHHHHPPQQPQQPPQPGAKAGDVTTGGASGLGSYVHHDNTSAASYDAQGFGQRLGGSSNEFKLPGASDATSNNGLPGLSFLGGASGAGAPPGMSSAGPARGGASSAAGTPGGSTPLDYRAFDASKSPAGRPAGTPGAGGPPPPPHGVPTPGAQQGTAAPMAAAQQHPAYYQQYAGFTQANAYDGYSYGRQPYWA